MAIRFWELFEKNKEEYKLKIIAGEGGMDTVVSWVHMLEDEAIIPRFKGHELAITTGMKGNHERWLLELVKQLYEGECIGLIINTGMYIDKISDEVVYWCEENKFPILTMPWEKSITYLIQDFCTQIIDQRQIEKRIGSTLLRAMNGTGNRKEYDEVLRSKYLINNNFLSICIFAHKTKEEEQKYTQSILKLENIFGTSRNTRKITTTYGILQVEDYVVLVLNDIQKNYIMDLPNWIRQSFQYFDGKNHLFMGIGPLVSNIDGLTTSYKRARIAMKMAIGSNHSCIDFETMGIYKILYSVEDIDLLKSYTEQMLGPIIEYDDFHNSDYLTTLRSYVKNDRSLVSVAEETFTHRNTVNYRIQNMKRLLNSELKTTQELFSYEIALMIYDMINHNIQI